ncbi:metal-dependent hydrolase [Candidatus Rariloculus sp.]|uniref:metal-dependent hydrolase n=1 Tax=Candidatus Rariloculus sp. TaxID=3101265 RepID=UPI003D0FE472
MDPIAHTFTGAALAASGLRRATPLATAALVLGANAPDIDIVAAFGPDFSSVAHRRGWTHGLPAIAAFPFLVTGLLLAWDRLVRLRLRPGAAPIRAGPLLGIAALGVATHSTLDWLNNYGIRWLMPFDGQWFYGDALFIIDPWIWLALGGSLFLMHARRIPSLAAWCAFWLLASVLVFATADVPQAARWLWVAGIGVLLGARAAGLSAPARERGVERVTRAALVVCVAYMAAASIANITARAEVRAALAVRGFGPVGHLMIGPVPANPFGGDVVAETPAAYFTGRWNWLARPRFESGSQISRLAPNTVSEAAAGTPEVQRFLTWARFPYFEIETADSGHHTVRFRDARYLGTDRLGSPTVILDGDLEPLYVD